MTSTRGAQSQAHVCRLRGAQCKIKALRGGGGGGGWYECHVYINSKVLALWRGNPLVPRHQTRGPAWKPTIGTTEPRMWTLGSRLIMHVAPV